MIEPGWYIPSKHCPPRWVLAVSATHVLYGNGGSNHRECTHKTFKAWMRRMQAARAEGNNNALRTLESS